MSGDPFGQLLRALFDRIFLGPAPVADVVALGALAAGLAAAVSLPLPVRPAPPPTPFAGRAAGLRRRATVAVGLVVPGAWDLLAGRAGLGALQTLAFGTSYAAARSLRGEGFLGEILLPAPTAGFFPDIPPGVPYLDEPALAGAAAALALALFLANVPLTLWRARPRAAPEADAPPKD